MLNFREIFIILGNRIYAFEADPSRRVIPQELSPTAIYVVFRQILVIYVHIRVNGQVTFLSGLKCPFYCNFNKKVAIVSRARRTALNRRALQSPDPGTPNVMSLRPI